MAIDDFRARGVTIFAPSPILTVTVEDRSSGDEIHIHAGGQGVWQARMLLRLGIPVRMCCVLSGETGGVLRHLLKDEGIHVDAVRREGRGAAYLHDRRSGERRSVADEVGDPLGRHELDELYGTTLRSALASRVTILSGPADESTLPADTYRRLAADLRSAGATVVADLAGERLSSVLAGGVDVLKVSDEELIADGLAGRDETGAVIGAMHALRARGAANVIVTRGSAPLLLLDDTGLLEVTPPTFEVADHRGAGDSLLAGVVSGLAAGEPLRDAITLGAAAGALNVTRHGLGSGDAKAVARLRERVGVRAVGPDGTDHRVSGKVTPDGLASLATPTGSIATAPAAPTAAAEGARP